MGRNGSFISYRRKRKAGAPALPAVALCVFKTSVPEWWFCLKVLSAWRLKSAHPGYTEHL